MNDRMNSLETWLNDIFVKSTPGLPRNAKKILIDWAPIASFVIGILALLSAWSLWHWANTAYTAAYYTGTICTAYSGYICPVPESHFSVWLWLGIILLVIEGLVYLSACTKLKDRKKVGWDYLYYGALINAAYAAVSLFTSYGGLSHFISALMGSAIGSYLLFQIRESYLGPKRLAPTKATDKKSDTH